MLFKYKEKPAEGTYVVCTVKTILNHSVFVTLDEYQNITGMIHISEIAPGRIRNIREFVSEGKKLICMILRIKTEREQYDLSLRRVQLNKKRMKLEEIKQEEKAEKILEITAKQLKLDFMQVYKSLTQKVFEKYAMLHVLFNEVALENESALKEFVTDGKLHDTLLENIKLRIKAEKIELKRDVTITSFESDGAELIKKAFDELSKNIPSEKVRTSYLGSGKYHIHISESDFEKGEEIYEKVKKIITDSLKNKAEVEFEAPIKGSKTEK